MKKEDKFFSRKIGLKNKIQGIFEETLSKGTVSIITWLAVAMILIVVLFSFVQIVMNLKPNADVDSLNLFEAMWQNFVHVIDTGALGNDQLWGYRIVSIIVTLFVVMNEGIAMNKFQDSINYRYIVWSIDIWSTGWGTDNRS